MKTESFRYSDYRIFGSKPSEIVEGHVHQVVIGVGCPRCHTVNPPIEHQQERECANCGLHMRRAGNALEIWV